MKTLLKFVVANLLVLDAMVAFAITSCWLYPRWVTEVLDRFCALIVLAGMKY